ncbi:actin-like ATPase domain-containing protein [Penicillium malachiteum]|uniref:Actin-like ATPase domain-containing protein n=1 Tax=Penicillium malachiteum TaxID=1324776 RepID=A0AAD6HJ52_9EURO|nr:actin-like ATPase domain-containing protein [Penicillium malachiteum]
MNSIESSSPTRLETPDCIIIGLDYGTTSTGVYVVKCEDGKAETQFIKWPEDPKALKVPSMIAYLAKNSNFSMRSPLWGNEIQPNMTVYAWTKLALDPNTEITEFDDEILNKTVSSGSPYRTLYLAGDKQPKDVISDYLQRVLKYVRALVPELRSMPVHLRFTIPAFWSKEARELSEAAVNQAWSFTGGKPEDTLSSMSEPEAAAESVYHMLKGALSPGDGILVCDCGGGTVDIVTYKVNHCAEFNLSMIQSIRGAKCGGAAIDCRLFHLMQHRLPKSAFEGLNHLIALRSSCMEAFEDVKIKFGTALAKGPFGLPLPMRRVVMNIARFIDSQIEAAQKQSGSVINKIVLVGGLAMSPYIQASLRGHFESSYKLSVIVPNDPILAVCDGATCAVKQEMARKPLHVPVVFKSPRHYGLGAANISGSSQADDHVAVKWVIRKGAEFLPYDTVSHEFSVLYYDGTAKEMTIPIYSCRGLQESSKGPGLQRDLSIDGNIPVNLAFMDFSDVRCELGPNNRLGYRLNYQISSCFSWETPALNFRVYISGEVVGMWSIRINMAN